MTICIILKLIYSEKGKKLCNLPQGLDVTVNSANDAGTWPLDNDKINVARDYLSRYFMHLLI